MTSSLPDWATAPPFDSEREWLPIVCTGGNGALSHPPELVGIYFDDPTLGWAYRGRPSTDGQYVAQIRPTRDGSERGSIVIRCHRCGREHRIGRDDFGRFLETSRASLPWANVSVLD